MSATILEISSREGALHYTKWTMPDDIYDLIRTVMENSKGMRPRMTVTRAVRMLSQVIPDASIIGSPFP